MDLLIHQYLASRSACVDLERNQIFELERAIGKVEEWERKLRGYGVDIVPIRKPKNLAALLDGNSANRTAAGVQAKMRTDELNLILHPPFKTASPNTGHASVPLDPYFDIPNDMAFIADLLEKVFVPLKGSLGSSISEVAKKHRFYGTSKELTTPERASYDRKYAVFWIIEKALEGKLFWLASDLEDALSLVQRYYPEEIAGERDAKKALTLLRAGHEESCLAASRSHQKSETGSNSVDPATRPRPRMPYPVFHNLPKIEPDFDALLTIVPSLAGWKNEDMTPENLALLRKRMRENAIQYMLLRDGSEKCAQRESLENSK